ncbi:MAG: hypothetical protein EOQ55_19980 [Mesorhizobium sp.]|uniref:hypothetical protein n=1 Tax=Mesorhizobium sp. TaxID=1871066 RepID=UPI000FE6F23A|nr:hypothetical protein [Mesorhizobium sp.]RWG17202.1 MAG: hypothetical protein EOQ55_19980 [Mesorhizobium sp.]
MNRDRRTSFGRRPTSADMFPVSAVADTSQLADAGRVPIDETRATSRRGAEGRVEALGLIICRLDELRQLAASQDLELLSYLLDVAFNESCDAIRRERSSAPGEENPR